MPHKNDWVEPWGFGLMGIGFFYHFVSSAKLAISLGQSKSPYCVFDPITFIDKVTSRLKFAQKESPFHLARTAKIGNFAASSVQICLV